MPRRGKILALASGTAAAVVLVLALLANKARIREWYDRVFGSEVYDGKVTVVMWWDGAASKSTIRLSRHKEPVEPESLTSDLTRISRDFERAGNRTWPLIIDAQPEVPWQDVIHLMDLCKRKGIERLEFAGEPPR